MTHVLVLDPESSGEDLVVALRQRGVAVTIWWQEVPFVLASPDSPSRPEPGLVRFADANVFDRIIAGSEAGVTAAEWLSARAGLPTSDPSLIHHRRDKNAMIEVISDAGLPSAASYLVTDADQISTLEGRLTLPVMVKPSSSAGSDLCRAVSSWEEARSFAARVLASTSIMGNKNTGAVVQEFIEGPQYHVNTVVLDGAHVVTEVYSNLFRHVDGVPHLYAGRSQPLGDDRVRAVVAYTKDCLRALGVSEGASHTEVRWTVAGPRLIEFNGRLMGPTQPSDYFVNAQGFSQATVLADAIAGRLADAKATLADRSDREFLGFYMLTAYAHGVLTAFDPGPLAGLPSFRKICKVPELGTAIGGHNRTTDAEMGFVLLAHRDAHQVDDDLASIGALEASQSLFTIEPAVEQP